MKTQNTQSTENTFDYVRMAKEIITFDRNSDKETLKVLNYVKSVVNADLTHINIEKGYQALVNENNDRDIIELPKTKKLLQAVYDNSVDAKEGKTNARNLMSRINIAITSAAKEQGKASPLHNLKPTRKSKELTAVYVALELKPEKNESEKDLDSAFKEYKKAPTEGSRVKMLNAMKSYQEFMAEETIKDMQKEQAEVLKKNAELLAKIERLKAEAGHIDKQEPVKMKGAKTA